jgi:hypothetical protein
MKKKKLKLALRKMKVSDLSNVKGGYGPQWVETLTQVGEMMCCEVIEETWTQLYTCWMHNPTYNTCDEKSGSCLP